MFHLLPVSPTPSFQIIIARGLYIGSVTTKDNCSNRENYQPPLHLLLFHGAYEVACRNVSLTDVSSVFNWTTTSSLSRFTLYLEKLDASPDDSTVTLPENLMGQKRAVNINLYCTYNFYQLRIEPVIEKFYWIVRLWHQPIRLWFLTEGSALNFSAPVFVFEASYYDGIRTIEPDEFFKVNKHGFRWLCRYTGISDWNFYNLPIRLFQSCYRVSG